MKQHKVKAYGAASASSPLAPMEIPRREPTARDVEIEILYCGICHSDLHSVRDEWNAMMPTVYPIVPGHEIVGRVARVGSSVSKFAVGDQVGVGCLVDSDRTCPACKQDLEQFCQAGVFTFNGEDAHLGGVTYGGYSASVVVDEHFVLRLPVGLDLAATAPLLCAGITTFSPLRRANLREGMKVGIVGLGGLGHMGVKFARAMGARVVVITSSESKRKDALRLGAHEVLMSRDAEAFEREAGSFDFILDTVSAAHELDPYVGLLRLDGQLTMVGAPAEPLSISAFSLLMGRRSVAGSLIGGIAETQEMLDFCGQHGIVADIELLPVQSVNEAYERLLKSDVRYRFVLDMKTL